MELTYISILPGYLTWVTFPYKSYADKLSIKYIMLENQKSSPKIG